MVQNSLPRLETVVEVESYRRSTPSIRPSRHVLFLPEDLVTPTTLKWLDSARTLTGSHCAIVTVFFLTAQHNAFQL